MSPDTKIKLAELSELTIGQSIESIFVVDLALHPRPASTAVAIADLGDRQVEVVLGHLLVSVVWLVNRFRVNTHEPCGLNRIKPDSKGIRILFFGAYLCAEMLGELRGCGLHISQFVEELFHGRWVGSGKDRHLVDRCVQVADRLERSSVRAEELGRGQAWAVGHGWHLVGPMLGWNETAFGMHTHEPYGLNGIKPISASFPSLLPCFCESPSSAHVRLCRVRLHVASSGVGGIGSMRNDWKFIRKRPASKARKMPEISPFQSQMMMLAGIILLGWILARRQIRSRSRLHSQGVADRDLRKQRVEADKPHGVPLASAPPELQRWQVEMFDLQRELKAELDMKIVVVQSLIRQADERIAALRNQAK
jgi:hypothetical protein